MAFVYVISLVFLGLFLILTIPLQLILMYNGILFVLPAFWIRTMGQRFVFMCCSCVMMAFVLMVCALEFALIKTIGDVIKKGRSHPSIRFQKRCRGLSLVSLAMSMFFLACAALCFALGLVGGGSFNFMIDYENAIVITPKSPTIVDERVFRCIESVKVKLDNCDVHFEEGEEFSIRYLHFEGEEPSVTFYPLEEHLLIESVGDEKLLINTMFADQNVEELFITIPKGFKLRSFEADIDIGEITFGQVAIDKAICKVEHGQIVGEPLENKYKDFEVGVGVTR